MRRAIGISLVALPFVAVFGFAIYTGGPAVALGILLALVSAGSIFGGVHLLTKGARR